MKVFPITTTPDSEKVIQHRYFFFIIVTVKIIIFTENHEKSPHIVL